MPSGGELAVGIVGYGEAGRFHAAHLTRAGARIVGAVTRRELDSGLRRFRSMADMLPDVDAVTIAVPNHLHASLCLEALDAGKPVFVEKPLALKAEELEALTRAFASAAVPVHVGFRLHWNTRLRALRERLDGIRRIRCIYRLGIDRLAEGKPWTRQEAFSGGGFFTLGVHALDLARWLAGARGEPMSDLRSSLDHYQDGTDFPLVVTMSGRLPSGVEIVAGADLRGNRPFRLLLEVDAASGAYPDPLLPGLAPEDEESEQAEYGLMMAEFYRAAKNRKNQPQELAEILQIHRELLAARSHGERV